MIANTKTSSGVGDGHRKKGIYEGSESIILDVLQVTQYIYPVKSAVREIVSNSLDSVMEKENHRRILNGDIKVEDLYVIKEGSEFKDSGYNPEYYDLDWLSNNKVVTIKYIENDTPTRDKIQFIDEGVGLGANRLEGYFQLG